MPAGRRLSQGHVLYVAARIGSAVRDRDSERKAKKCRIAHEIRRGITVDRRKVEPHGPVHVLCGTHCGGKGGRIMG